MGMTDEQLEAYERQEREVCDITRLAVSVQPSKGELKKRIENGEKIALICKELATCSEIFRHSTDKVVVTNNSYIDRV